MKRFDLIKKCIFLLSLLSVSYTHALVSSMEREALVTLYNTTDGINWDSNENWLIGDPCENSWYGIGCNGFRNGSIDTVTSLNLSNNKLNGPIPQELSNLTNLGCILMSNNKLNGEIPFELGNLEHLGCIYLDFNQLTGSIPSSIGNLTQLIDLSLYFNNLHGQIPEELGELINLKRLILSFNNFTNEIPEEIGYLTSLEQLELEQNNLSGTFPLSQILNLVNLKRLDLSNNKFTARSLPIELAALNNLVTLSLSGNNFNGTLTGISAFNQLSTLRLCGNQFTGVIPVEIGNLTNLTSLELCGNKLSGQIPKEIGDLTTLYDLLLSQNNLTGIIPDEMGNMTNLSTLLLEGNQLSGEIPITLMNLKNLNTISSINWNNLYTNNPELITFLDMTFQFFPWINKQSLSPENVQIIASSANSVSLNWNASNSLREGGYQIYMASNIAGPFTLIHETQSKSVTAYSQVGLQTGQDYYFKIKTFTSPHSFNKNRVISDDSDTVIGITDITTGTVDLFTQIMTDNIDIRNKITEGKKNKSKLGIDFTYSILVGNTGMDQSVNTNFKHQISLGLENATWNCTTNFGNATCPNETGTGNIDEMLNLTTNSILEYQVTVFRDHSHEGSIYISTTATPPEDMSDSNFTNNSQVENIIETVFANAFE
jgi:Leucine-rich repeat (LRR) protein